MVLHSLQKLQVLITKWTTHLSSERAAGTLAHRPATKHTQFAKADYGRGYCFQYKDNKEVNWLRVQAAILPSPGRFVLKSTLALPSSRLKGEGAIFIYPPRPSLLPSRQCVLPDSVCCLLPQMFFLLIHPEMMWSIWVCQNPQMPLFTCGSSPPSSYWPWGRWENLTNEPRGGKCPAQGLTHRKGSKHVC